MTEHLSLTEVFEESRVLVSSVERWVDFVTPFASPLGDIMRNDTPGVDKAFHAAFWQVKFAIDCGYALIAEHSLTELQSERSSGPDWQELTFPYCDTKILRQHLTLRDTNPLPEWVVRGLTTAEPVIDIRRPVGTLIELIGSRRQAGMMSRFWELVDRNSNQGPLCTGFTASWCPNCGDCTCPRSVPVLPSDRDQYHTDRNLLGAAGCPLHDRTISLHTSRNYPKETVA